MRFSDVYKDAFGESPPDWFQETYIYLAEAIYRGIKRGAEPVTLLVGGKRRRPTEYWPLHAWELIEVKADVDRRLAWLSRAVQEWQQKTRQASGQRVPGKAG